MARSNLQELLDVLEEIRQREHPEIPAEVIVAIAHAQYDNQDNRSTARQKTSRIIADYLASAVPEDGEVVL